MEQLKAIVCAAAQTAEKKEVSRHDHDVQEYKDLIEDQSEHVPHHYGRSFVYDIHHMQSDVICIDLRSCLPWHILSTSWHCW